LEEHRTGVKVDDGGKLLSISEKRYEKKESTQAPLKGEKPEVMLEQGMSITNFGEQKEGEKK